MRKEAILLTQYERYGVLRREDFLQYFIDEELEVNLSLVGRYNEWLAEQGDAGFTADWEELVKQLDPVEAVRATYYGRFSMGDDWFTFDGYQNIESYTDRRLVKEMKGNTDFLSWLIEKDDLIDWEKADRIMKKRMSWSKKDTKVILMV